MGGMILGPEQMSKTSDNYIPGFQNAACVVCREKFQSHVHRNGGAGEVGRLIVQKRIMGSPNFLYYIAFHIIRAFFSTLDAFVHFTIHLICAFKKNTLQMKAD